MICATCDQPMTTGYGNPSDDVGLICVTCLIRVELALGEPLYVATYNHALEVVAAGLERDASTYYDQYMSYDLGSSDAAVVLRAAAKAARARKQIPAVES